MSNYLENISIMIVDDQEFAIKMIKNILGVLGATDFKVYQHADQAWQAFSEEPPDIVILDWAMQPVDGIAFTKRIRELGTSPNPYVPIIMLTAHAERRHVFEARDAGVNEYVIKPISPKTLFSRIQAVCEKPRNFVKVGDFFGPDRRRVSKDIEDERRTGDAKHGAGGEAEKPKGPPPDMDEKMSQDEINATFNPT